MNIRIPVFQLKLLKYSIVLPNPSSKPTFGCQFNFSFANAISGRLRTGSHNGGRCHYSTILEPQSREGRQGCIFVFFLIRTDDHEKRNALRANHSFSLLTIRFMPSFINGTFQFRRKPRLRLVSLR